MDLFFIFLLGNIITINAFNPLDVPGVGTSDSATHEAITRCAVATVTGEYINTTFGISVAAPTVTNGICPSSFYDQLKAAFGQVANKGGKSYTDWKTYGRLYYST